MALHDRSQGLFGSELDRRHRARSLPRKASNLVMSTESMPVRGEIPCEQQLVHRDLHRKVTPVDEVSYDVKAADST
jgi:hypothetical protein